MTRGAAKITTYNIEIQLNVKRNAKSSEKNILWMIYVFDYLLVTRNSEDLKVIEVKCEVKCEVKKSLQQYNYQHLNKQTRELVIPILVIAFLGDHYGSWPIFPNPFRPIFYQSIN